MTTIMAFLMLIKNHLLRLERDTRPLLGGENLAVALPIQRQWRRGKPLLSILKLSIFQLISRQRREGGALLSILKLSIFPLND